MTEVLDRPQAAAPATELTLPARAAVALDSSATEKHLAALVEKAQAIAAISNTAGRDECHSTLMTLVAARTTVEKTSKAAREDATKFSKAVIAEENRLCAITEAEETRLRSLRDAWDAERKAEREAKLAAERARVTALGERIAHIKSFATLALECRTAAKVSELIGKLGAIDMTGFEEFEPEAQSALTYALLRLGEIHSAKLADEEERARAKAERDAEELRLRTERADLESQRAEQARIEAESLASIKAEADALAANRAEFARQQAEFKAQQQAEVDRRAAAAAEALRQEQYAADLEALAKAVPAPAPEPVTAPAVIAAAFEADQAAEDTPAAINPDPCGPPTALALIQCVAAFFKLDDAEAAYCLTLRAFDIANFTQE